MSPLLEVHKEHVILHKGCLQYASRQKHLCLPRPRGVLEGSIVWSDESKIGGVGRIIAASMCGENKANRSGESAFVHPSALEGIQSLCGDVFKVSMESRVHQDVLWVISYRFFDAKALHMIRYFSMTIIPYIQPHRRRLFFKKSISVL